MTAKQSFNTIAIISIITLFIIMGIGTAIDTTDIDETCSENNSLLKRVAGTWICSQTHYAEGYFHSYASPLIITITNSSQYYNITNLIMAHTNGITFENNGVTITKARHYQINGGLSFTGGNGGLYEFEIHKNGIGQENCVFFRETANAIGYAGITCILELQIGDHLNIMIKDLGNPAQNIQISQANLNIMEII